MADRRIRRRPAAPLSDNEKLLGVTGVGLVAALLLLLGHPPACTPPQQ